MSPTTSHGPQNVPDGALSMTPRGGGSSFLDGLNTPPSSRGKSSVHFVGAEEASYSSESSNILSPRGLRSHDVELTTPKTPEEEQKEEETGSQSGFLPTLSQVSGNDNYQQYAQRQLQLPPLSPNTRSAGKAGSRGGPPKRSQTYVQQLSRESARELAKTAFSMRSTSVGDFTFDNPHDVVGSSLRESIRRVTAFSRREAPLDTELNTVVRVDHHVRKCELRLDPETITWSRGKKILGVLATDDVVGAELIAKKKATSFRVHYFKKGRGTGSKALLRTPKFVDFHCLETEVVDSWVGAIQELVRWQARAPPISEKRMLKVVVNPHSGKRQARRIWETKVKPFLELGNFEYVVEETTHSGHGAEMGKSYSADDGFEALVFIGGDGTLCEFMNGLLTRPEHEWREIVASTPISLISAGTQNAFGTGAGIPTVNAALYCILKRKMRPLDVVTAVSSANPEVVHYSYCGLGWGVAGDIAEESERYRWMGTLRYAFLKVKRTVVLPKKHTGRVRYVLTEPQPPLLRYDDYPDAGALDQFEVEEGTVYDMDRFSQQRKSWGGIAGSISSPASRKRYPEFLWKEDNSSYVVVGVVNITPDGAFSHPSDGNLDLIITRKGSLLENARLFGLYVMGKELQSPLISYLKVKAVEIEPDQTEDCMNIDGEVLEGGPWRMEVVPSLFKVLSEK
ncbi:Sphingosine kinase 1 [Phytophthora citrophthora]|uniref:Sphingosine kinase 1 n=1 Tax=Phytophthora citrophthora TaxID=4793 RepID=A0AAD9GPT9_9STRA|nr:Sphingosine kinase 1 [Phytophthora citrophthora]